ncbi:MAG: alcohol dehydrogenase catalytic domain-containing protein [Lachnospiraceae bacterium]
MINTRYKLTTPYVIETFCESLDLKGEEVLVRPEMLSICKADMRYFFGTRDAEVLNKRLPLVLIHEAVGTVLYDQKNRFMRGQKVVLLPNKPGIENECEENYRLDSLFCSSRADGFMQEIVSLPENQLVTYENIPINLAAYVEFISVGAHALRSYQKRKVSEPRRVGVWGDGGLGYIMCVLLKHYYPETHVTLIGVNPEKLSMFQFIDRTCRVDELDLEKTQFDDVFECVGGQSSGKAISQMIDTIKPEGIITLLGVSEEPVPILTRMVLEKGITLIGRSRSTRVDFEEVVSILSENETVKNRLLLLVSEEMAINNINDISIAFEQAKMVDFKVVMKWNI